MEESGPRSTVSKDVRASMRACELVRAGRQVQAYVLSAPPASHSSKARAVAIICLRNKPVISQVQTGKESL